MTHGSQLPKLKLLFSLFFLNVFLFAHYKFNLPTGSKLERLEFSLILLPWSFAWGLLGVKWDVAEEPEARLLSELASV